MRTRLSIILAAAGVLAGLAFATPAGAVTAVFTGSQITSPSGPRYELGSSDGAHAFTVAGTVTGAPGSIQHVDINCYDAGNNVVHLKSDVPTATDGSFSADITQDEANNASAFPCVLRAVPAGETTKYPPPSAPADNFKGPDLAVTTQSQSIDGTTGQMEDFGYWNVGFHGELQFNSAEAGIAASHLFTPSTFAASPSLADEVNGFNGGNLIVVDGYDSYVPGSAWCCSASGWLGITNLHTSFDPATGSLVVSDHEPLSQVGPSFPPYTPAGVELDRTWKSGADGRTAQEVDTWRSTDGHQHTLQLQYESTLASVDSGTFGVSGGAIEFPGSSGFDHYAQGQNISLPSGPGTIYLKYDHGTADSGDGASPQGGLTYAVAPDGPANIESEGQTGIEFTLPYNRTIPAGGSTTLRFAWAQDYSLASVQAFAAQAIAGWQPHPAGNGGGSPVQPFAPGPQALPGLALLGKLLLGDGVSFTLGCGNGPCNGLGTLTTSELIRSPGNKLVGLAKRRTRHRTVTIGRAAFSIASGAHRTVNVKLNGNGRKLLAHFKRLPAKLTVTVNGQSKPVLTKQVTLKPKPKKRHRRH